MADQPGLEANFNPREAAASLARSQRERVGRKLSFFEQCGAFYALYTDIDAKYVAKAFGISRAAASQLGGCLERDPRPFKTVVAREQYRIPIYDGGMDRYGGRGAVSGHEMVRGEFIDKLVDRDMNRHRSPNRTRRYRRVAQEFLTLGEESFAAKYYTHALHERLMHIKHEIDRIGDDRRRDGPNRLADSHSFAVIGAFECGVDHWRVDWLDDHSCGPGWYYIDCKPDGSQPDGPAIPYYSRDDNQPFARSKLAYDAVFKRING